MPNLILTGANGLVGRHLIERSDDRWSIHAVSRDGTGSEAGSGAGSGRANVTAVAADLSRPIDTAALPPQIDAVAYLAQSNRFREFPAGAADMAAVNVGAMLTLIDHAVAAGARTFVYASTGGVYGTGPDPFREDAPPARSLGFYPASKLAAEVLARAYEARIAVVVLRFFFVYGRGQKPGMLVPRLVESVREGREIGLQGRDGLSINPIHAADAADAVAAALTLTEGATINVAGPETLTLRRMGEEIGAALGTVPRFAEQPDAVPGDLVGDIAAQTALLGAPQIRFADGVRDLL